MKIFNLCSGNGKHPGFRDITEPFEGVFERLVEKECKISIDLYYLILQMTDAYLCPICGRIFVKEVTIMLEKYPIKSNSSQRTI